MQQFLFSIRDSKGNMFQKPFPQLTQQEALRTFSDLSNDPKTTISVHPEDYDLYYLGTYDTISGKIEPVKSPEHIAKAINMLHKESAESPAN